jgi:hypothetical protein
MIKVMWSREGGGWHGLLHARGTPARCNTAAVPARSGGQVQQGGSETGFSSSSFFHGW